MTKHLDVDINGRKYRVGCAPGQEQHLTAAANYVDQEIRNLAKRHGSASMDKLAVMLALNLAHQVLTQPTLAKATEPHGNDSPDARFESARRELGRLSDLLSELIHPGHTVVHSAS